MKIDGYDLEINVVQLFYRGNHILCLRYIWDLPKTTDEPHIVTKMFTREAMGAMYIISLKQFFN